VGLRCEAGETGGPAHIEAFKQICLDYDMNTSHTQEIIDNRNLQLYDAMVRWSAQKHGTYSMSFFCGNYLKVLRELEALSAANFLQYLDRCVNATYVVLPKTTCANVQVACHFPHNA
jgi:hypothetical protein